MLNETLEKLDELEAIEAEFDAQQCTALADRARANQLTVTAGRPDASKVERAEADDARAQAEAADRALAVLFERRAAQQADLDRQLAALPEALRPIRDSHRRDIVAKAKKALRPIFAAARGLDRQLGGGLFETLRPMRLGEFVIGNDLLTADELNSVQDLLDRLRARGIDIR